MIIHPVRNTSNNFYIMLYKSKQTLKTVHMCSNTGGVLSNMVQDLSMGTLKV